MTIIDLQLLSGLITPFETMLDRLGFEALLKLDPSLIDLIILFPPALQFLFELVNSPCHRFFVLRIQIRIEAHRIEAGYHLLDLCIARARSLTPNLRRWCSHDGLITRCCRWD